VPISDLQNLEATIIQNVLATIPVKFVAAYLSPIRHLMESDVTECLNGGFPFLMVGSLNAKHMD
jgi:hypothetical protein